MAKQDRYPTLCARAENQILLKRSGAWGHDDDSLRSFVAEPDRTKQTAAKKALTRMAPPGARQTGCESLQPFDKPSRETGVEPSNISSPSGVVHQPSGRWQKPHEKQTKTTCNLSRNGRLRWPDWPRNTNPQRQPGNRWEPAASQHYALIAAALAATCE